MIFFVQDPGGSGHPLNIPFSDDSAVATTVVVSYFPLIGNGYRFKTPVGVYSNPTRCFTGRKLHFCIVIQQEERTHSLLTDFFPWEKTMDSESISHHMGRWWIYDCFDYFFLVHKECYYLRFIDTKVHFIPVLCIDAG